MVSLQEKSSISKRKPSRINWKPAELKAWALPKNISVSEWADENRILGMLSAEPGKWRTDRTPYLRGIMDSFSDPSVKEITIKASTQIGKTESFLNIIGYAIDQDPGSTLVVMPTKEEAKTFSKERIKTMIELSPTLSDHLTGEDDDITKFVMKLDRMNLYMAWATSPAALSSKAIKNLIFDEINKYPFFSGKEADPIKLGSERTRTFWNSKTIKVSSPTLPDGYITREFDRSDKCKFYVPCPHCGKYQYLMWSQVKFPREERDPEIIKQKQLAWYECIECKGTITNDMKQKMMLKGKWLPEGATIDKEGNIKGNSRQSSHKGFWINVLYSPWTNGTLAHVVAEWLSCQGRNELLMNFVNSWLAEEWKETSEKRKPEELKKLAFEYEAGTVPDGAMVLTAGIDVQKDHFYYVIRGFGVGYESWLIKSGYVETWEEIIAQVIDGKFISEIKGVPDFQISLANIDTGNRTEEVYQKCRELRGILRPIKGRDNLRGLLYQISTIDKFPNGKIIPEGLKLYHIDTNIFKDKIARLIGIEGENKKFHLHRNPSEKYIQQMCAEAKTPEKGKKPGQRREVWQPISLHTPNHFWDAEVYAFAAAEMLMVYALREEDKPKPVESIQEVEHSSENTWLGNRKNWLKR